MCIKVGWWNNSILWCTVKNHQYIYIYIYIWRRSLISVWYTSIWIWTQFLRYMTSHEFRISTVRAVPLIFKIYLLFYRTINGPFFLYINTWIIDTSVLWILFLYAGSGLYESFDTCISYTRMVKFLSKNTTGYILPWLKSGAKISPSG